MDENLEKYFEVCFKHANQMICKNEKIDPETVTLILSSLKEIIKLNNKQHEYNNQLINRCD
jgi:hypothetical protein